MTMIHRIILCCFYIVFSAVLSFSLSIRKAISWTSKTKYWSYPTKMEIDEDTTKRLRILCLHGYLSSGKLFKAQLQKLVNEASDTSIFTFLDAPHRLGLQKRELVRKSQQYADENSLQTGDNELSGPRPGAAGKFRWWYAGVIGTGDEEELVQYMGLRESLMAIAEADKIDGPFDVILGHSQGACLAITVDALNSRPEFLQTLLKDNELEQESNDAKTIFTKQQEQTVTVVAAAAASSSAALNETNVVEIDRLLPLCSLSIVISGFQPRDYLFNKLFSDIEIESTMRGISQRSLHVFSHEDEIVPAAASIQAMTLYSNPKMKIRNGDHDPPRDDDTVTHIAKALSVLWTSKFNRKPLVLED